MKDKYLIRLKRHNKLPDDKTFSLKPMLFPNEDTALCYLYKNGFHKINKTLYEKPMTTFGRNTSGKALMVDYVQVCEITSNIK